MLSTRFRVSLCLALIALTALISSGLSFAPTAAAAEPDGKLAALARVMAIQDRNTERLLAIKGVVGTATGLDPAGRPVIKVYAAKADVPGIPRRLEGQRVLVEVTGEFFALDKPAAKPDRPGKPGGGGGGGGEKIDRKARFDSPVPIGVSVGNEFSCSAGTIGCTLTDSLASYALSNHHVLDPWDAVERGIYERIVQPGRLDDPNDTCYGAATPENILGKIVDSIPIDYSINADNTVDAAIAIIPTADYQGDGECRTLGIATPLRSDGSSDGYGTPGSDPIFVLPGDPVQKYGRTTGLTTGTISGIAGTINVGYSAGTARFVSQIVISGKGFLKSGDSGSLLVTDDANNDPVGLLFAGDRSGRTAIANPIDMVLDQLNQRRIPEAPLFIDGR